MPTWIAGIYERVSGRAGERASEKRDFRLFTPSPLHPFTPSVEARVVPPLLSATSGFTLLELTVVLFIVGLLIATVIPHLGNVGGARLDATAKRLAAVVRYLAGEAALQNRPYRLNYDLDNHTYWITTLVATQDGAEFKEDQSLLSRAVRLPYAITFADVQAPGVGRVSAGRVYTHFLPQGYTDPTLIHLRDQYSRVVTVLIPALTGEARIYEGYVDGFVRR
jgi:general secretion pathway protein H